ncbi:MAG: hypothetical protein GY851_08815 [bacterium]|nr:hypothetical protein [bacterium]
MASPNYLFDMKPFDTHELRSRRFRRLPPRLQEAFGRLKNAMDALPQDEYHDRQRACEDFERRVQAR